MRLILRPSGAFITTYTIAPACRRGWFSTALRAYQSKTRRPRIRVRPTSVGQGQKRSFLKIRQRALRQFLSDSSALPLFAGFHFAVLSSPPLQRLPIRIRLRSSSSLLHRCRFPGKHILSWSAPLRM